MLEECYKLLACASGYCDFVLDAPAEYRRVVVVLLDELDELLLRVFIALGAETGDNRYFCPDEQSALVSEIIEIAVLLIVGEAHRIRADIEDYLDILRVLLLGYGIAHVLSVLVAGDTLELDVLAV